MTVDVERVREEALLGWTQQNVPQNVASWEASARLNAENVLALCDELDRTREQLREAREALWHLSRAVAKSGENTRGRMSENERAGLAVARDVLARLAEATP